MSRPSHQGPECRSLHSISGPCSCVPAGTAAAFGGLCGGSGQRNCELQEGRPDLARCAFPIWPGRPRPSSGTKGLTRAERIPLPSSTSGSSQGQGPQDRAREADPAAPEALGFSLSLLLLPQRWPLPRIQHLPTASRRPPRCTGGLPGYTRQHHGHPHTPGPRTAQPAARQRPWGRPARPSGC